MQSKWPLCELLERLFSRAHSDDLDVIVADQLDHAALLVFVVFDDHQALHAIVDERPNVAERFVQLRLVDRLLEVGDRARHESLLASVDTADDVDGDVARVGVVLEAIEHLPPVDHRHVDVERDRVRLVLVGERDPGLAVERDDSHEALLARHVEQDAGEVEIVLHDEHDAVAGLNRIPIIWSRWVGTGNRELGTGNRERGTELSFPVHQRLRHRLARPERAATTRRC